MFYPVDSLKRGGRFYLCWVADSWPLRFATITHRQLWSQDIRKICDDLIEVMTNESGRPANRFSLRLSSQLMRGLVRLYQRKVTVFLGDLCMINATVTKHVNKKWNIHEIAVEHVQRRLPPLPLAQLVVPEEAEQEQRIEELIQNSGNVVGNIQDITLKESTFPQVQPPPNDGFGEENPEQALQMLQEQSLELMLAGHAGTSLHHSGLGPALDTSDKSHDRSADRSRLAIHQPAMMERISEHDVTLFRKSTGEELTMGGFEKDIPEIPEVPLPELTVPPPEKQIITEENPVEEMHIAEKTQQEEPALVPPQKELVEIELEELEEPQAKRRRLKNKLIIDKKIKLGGDYLVTRIENPFVDLRCEDSTDDIADIRMPADILFRRPTHAGPRLYQNLSLTLTVMYQRNLGVIGKQPLAEREIEEAIADRYGRVRTRSILERIEEEPAAIEPQAQINQPMPEVEGTRDILNVTEPQNATIPVEQVDIFDLPTQKLYLEEETPSQSKKRVSEYEISPKRQRLIGYVSFRQSQQQAVESSVPIIEAEKENLPEQNISLEDTIKESYRDTRVLAPRDTNIQRTNEVEEKSLSVMLQEAGLADLPPKVVVEEQEMAVQIDTTQRTARRGGSESSETPLGSLDRTKVSLGDSDQTTDSKRFIRDQWGTEGTMIKILGSLRAGMKPLTVRKLITKGPVIAGYKCIIAARCFTSILKLKQHGFIVVKKDPETLEIRDISLGPKLDQIR